MTDANYSRLPDVGSEDTSELKQEAIFTKPKEDLAMKPPAKVEEVKIQKKVGKAPKPVLSEEEQAAKKKRLCDHLAMCREKSAISRAKLKAERIANKRPRGRPKKMPGYDEAVPPPKVEPVAPPLETIPEIEEVNKVVPPPVPKPSGIAKPDKPINADFNMIDYEKLTNMIAMKMQPPKPVVTKSIPPPPQETKPVKNQNQMTNFLEQYSKAIRADENKKIKAQQDAEKKKQLHEQTRRYYGKLAPTNMFEPTTDWDNLFNTRNGR